MPVLLRNQQKARRLRLRRIENELLRLLALVRMPGAELSVLFVGSAAMQSLNSRYRGIRKETDVLSFPMAGTMPGEPAVLGDIVISVPRAHRQAGDYGTSLHKELRRLLVHGLLHLIGYDHETGADAAKMRRKEDALFHALATMD